MDFELKDVLEAVGPNASLVFASWIFMTFLQARYTSAYDRYRSLINDYREGLDGKRKDVIQGEILLYRRRVELMRRATNLGLYAAMLLIGTLIVGALDAVFGGPPPFKYLGALCALGGLATVIWSACLVVKENTLIRQAIGGELRDIPELADRAGEPRA
jgi:hypothetical protein